MTPARWRLLGLLLCSLTVVVAILVIGQSRRAPLDSSSPCEITIAGEPAAGARQPRQAIVVNSAGTMVVSGTDPTATPVAAVEATLSPSTRGRGTWTVSERHFGPPVTDFQVAVDMSDVAGYGIGMNLVTVRTDDCAVPAWVRVEGRPPVFTAFGVLGFGLASIGLIAIAVNLWRSAAGGAATFPGALGAGIPYGAGMGLLAQQAGVMPLSPATFGAAAIMGSATAGLLHLARRSLSARKQELVEPVDDSADQSPIWAER